MKFRNLIVCLFLGFTVASCIQDEAPNAEADILTCTISDDILKREPILQNSNIIIMVKPGTDLQKLAPEFTLTPGATISPNSGSVLDFSKEPQEYTVTSQSGEWKKKYTVTITDTEISTIYHFENIKSDYSKYNIFIEESEDKVTMEWASGNEGFAITASGSPATDYPTVQSADGKVGKCAKLTTKSTGSIGAGFGMPIAAGNLFIGEFKLNITNPLKATKFGLPFYNVPTFLTGYYKYKAGDVFLEKGKENPKLKDQCDIYAVFYDTDHNTITLDGTNTFTHPNIISIARVDNPKETDSWTQFYIPFETKAGKYIDKEKLKAGEYNISIVFAASIDGAKFNGAVGSTLYIDEVELIYNNK